MEKPFPDSPLSISESEIREEMERLLASREFSHAERLSRFLRFVVERTLAGDRESLKESVIGATVYDRGPAYDPKAEPIVRTEARRLRAKLAEFYEHSGPDSRIRISVPTGGYVAFFEARPSTPNLAVIPRPEPAGTSEPVAAESPAFAARPRRLWLLPVILVGLAVAAFAVWRLNPPRHHTEYSLTTVTSYPGAESTPAISPDGQQVAFAWSEDKALADDLYLAAIDGGTPRRLTSAHAGDTLPAWSHDGAQIAFIRADTLMVVSTLGGGERSLGAAFPSWVSWAPGANVLLISDWVPERHVLALFSVNELTGVRRQLTFPPHGITGDTAGAISPDGASLAFIRCNLANCDIFISPASAAAPRRLTHDECGFAGLAWMPDGQSLVYSSRRRGPYMLWQVGTSGGDPEQVPSSGDDARAPRAARAPSGKTRIVFEYRFQNANIWSQRMDFNSSHPDAAQPQRVLASTRQDSSPQISPDGKHIVFVSDRTGRDEIWAAAADGSNPRALTRLQALAGSPRWSPDGARIAFDLLTKNGRAVFLTDANGAPPQQWTPWGAASRPSWSHDGRWIYYGAEDTSGRQQVWKISTAPDRSIVQITKDGGFEAFESPDGATLYYTRESELRRMPTAGGAWTKVTDLPVRPGWWSVSRAGIYFADLPEPKSIVFDGPFQVLLLNPENGQTRHVATVKGAVFRSTPDFTTSLDGSSLYYCLLEISTSQIRMLETL